MEQQIMLPALPKLPAKEMAGPTPWCNWVIPGRVIGGAYPASLDDAETERILVTLLELGINTFVCLQAEVNINTPEQAWRAGHGLRPYIKDAQKILSRAHETGSPRITQQKIDFLHLPIIDGNVTTDSALNRLAEDCMERILRGEKLYIHCWGGHGRTGTLVAVLLGRLYGLPYTTAIRYTQAFHDSRVYPQGVRSPQTPVQRAQVRRLLASQSVSSTPMSSASVPRTPTPLRSGQTPLHKPTTPPAYSKTASTTPTSLTSRASAPTPTSSILNGASARTPATADPGSRTSASPLRASTPTMFSATRRRSTQIVNDSPLKTRPGDVRSSQDLIKAVPATIDRLSSDFGRLTTGNNTPTSRSVNGLPNVARTPTRGTAVSAINGRLSTGNGRDIR